nr:MAG TPA: hypothetical protein [Caudoviricetes sp.]
MRKRRDKYDRMPHLWCKNDFSPRLRTEIQA